MDAANPDDAQKAVDVAQARFGGIDHPCPAGLYLAQPVQEMTDAQWRQTIAINLDGVFYSRAAPSRTCATAAPSST